MTKYVYMGDEADMYQFIDMFIRATANRESIFIHDSSLDSDTGFWCYERKFNGSMTFPTKLELDSDDTIIIITNQDRHISCLDNLERCSSVRVGYTVNSVTFDLFIEEHCERIGNLWSVKCLEHDVFKDWIEQHHVPKEAQTKFDTVFRKSVIKFCAKQWFSYLKKSTRFDNFNNMTSFEKMIQIKEMLYFHSVMFELAPVYTGAFFEAVALPSMLALLESKSSKS